MSEQDARAAAVEVAIEYGERESVKIGQPMLAAMFSNAYADGFAAGRAHANASIFRQPNPTSGNGVR